VNSRHDETYIVAVVLQYMSQRGYDPNRRKHHIINLNIDIPSITLNFTLFSCWLFDVLRLHFLAFTHNLMSQTVTYCCYNRNRVYNCFCYIYNVIFVLLTIEIVMMLLELKNKLLDWTWLNFNDLLHWQKSMLVAW